MRAPIPQVKVEKRAEPSKGVTLAVLVASLALALFVVAFVFWGYGVNPLDVYSAIFIGSFGSLFGWSWTITKAIPLLLCGVGLAVAFKALFWNIGAEGQLLMGAVGASGVALYLIPDAPPILLIPTMFAMGFLCGGAWGLIPAILKAKLKANEVITTLMMNYIAGYFVNYLVIWPGPWNGPGEYSFPYSSLFTSSAWLPYIPGTSIHYPTLVLGLALAIFMYVLVRRTKLGYEIRVIGENPEAARYAGMSYFKTVMLVMLMSGGIAGLAGVGEVAGIHHRLRIAMGVSPGYGYTAIIVAWLGRLNPLGVILSSLLFGGLLVGGDKIQVTFGLPIATISIFNGIILFFMLGGELLMHYKVVWRRPQRGGERRE